MKTAPQTAHTPLPWAVDKHGVIKGGVFREYTNGSSQDQIAMVRIPRENNGDQNANAELIVRAVNSHAQLLAALEKLCDDADQASYHLSRHNERTRATALDERIEQAREAIAKATQ